MNSKDNNLEVVSIQLNVNKDLVDLCREIKRVYKKYEENLFFALFIISFLTLIGFSSRSHIDGGSLLICFVSVLFLMASGYKFNKIKKQN